MTTLNIPSSPSQGATYEANGVVYTWDGTKWKADSSYVSNLNGGQLAGFRNQLINSDFRIAARGKITALNLTSSQFVADRWNLSGPGRAGNASVEDGVLAGIPCLNLPTNFTSSVFLNTTVELPAAGSAGPFQLNSIWTFSVWSTSNLAGVTPFAVFRDNRDSQTNQQANTVGALAATGATPIGAFNQYTATVTITATPSATNLCLYLGFEVTIGGRFSLLQLEPGPVATPFEHRPIGTELALCQRYYYKNDRGWRAQLASAGGGNTAKYVREPRPTTMRSSPTETATTSSGTLSLSGTAESFNLSVNSVSEATGVQVSDYTADAEL
jgi:hypothetical protein